MLKHVPVRLEPSESSRSWRSCGILGITGRPDQRFGWLRTALEAHGAFWEIMERSFGSVGILVVGILVLGFWEPKSDRNRSHTHLQEKLHVVNQKSIMRRPFLSSSQHNGQAWAFILFGNGRWEIMFSYDFPNGIVNFYKFPTECLSSKRVAKCKLFVIPYLPLGKSNGKHVFRFILCR